jgi:hypothetical protein
MVGSKDHTDISATNIIKPTLEAFPADDQQPFDDLMRREEEEVLRQLPNDMRGRRKKYLSYFYGGSPLEDHP